MTVHQTYARRNIFLELASELAVEVDVAADSGRF